MKACLLFSAMLLVALLTTAQSSLLQQYVSDLRNTGREPVAFIRTQLQEHDLIVFDDALHSAYEPFQFYQQLISNPDLKGKFRYIFLEIFCTTAQPAIDSFLAAPQKDSTILLKTFQDDYSGNGLGLQTYLDLFNTVRDYNLPMPDSLKIKLIAVSPPVYWEAMHTWKDYELFQESLKARDYFMYLEILRHLGGFTNNKKGIFLTNTRHAYKNIRHANGELYWNTNTFFAQWHPEKTYSIRLHNVTLYVSAQKNTGERKSTEGLTDMVYKWARMDGGRWDSAFALTGNKPTAVPFANTAFGRTGYVGNHMRDVLKGTVMNDAYDALIFLAPLSALHLSAHTGFLYTPAFRGELRRRMELLKGDKFDIFLKNNRVAAFDEYYRKLQQYTPVVRNAMLEE